MYCKNCGAVVVGKFCSCCGTKIRRDVDQYILDRRRMQKEFADAPKEYGSSYMHLATACWYVYECKLLKGDIVVIGGERFLAPDAYERLAAVKAHATALFNRLKAEVL